MFEAIKKRLIIDGAWRIRLKSSKVGDTCMKHIWYAWVRTMLTYVWHVTVGLCRDLHSFEHPLESTPRVCSPLFRQEKNSSAHVPQCVCQLAKESGFHLFRVTGGVQNSCLKGGVHSKCSNVQKPNKNPWHLGWTLHHAKWSGMKSWTCWVTR